MQKHTTAINLSIFILSVFIISGCASTPSPRAAAKPLGPMTSVTAAPSFATPRDVYHIVGPSETLWRIAKTYDVDINTVLRANHLDDPTKVKNGQKLLIPQTRGPRPVIPLYPTQRWTYIVIHHTATDEGDAYSIDEIHHKRGFWNGLGYHFLIDNGTEGKSDGQIQVGPRWIKQQDGAHANAAGMNEKGIGIVIVGNFSQQHVTERELENLVFLTKTLMAYYHIPASNVIRHKDVPGKNTECPGNNFPWSEFKSRI